MSRVDVTPAGRQDLYEIWEYVAQHDPTAANDVVRKINSSLGVLAQFPDVGTDRSEFGDGLRGHVIKPYIVYYRRTADGIEVVRVLHGARKIDHSYFD